MGRESSSPATRAHILMHDSGAHLLKSDLYLKTSYIELVQSRYHIRHVTIGWFIFDAWPGVDGKSPVFIPKDKEKKKLPDEEQGDENCHVSVALNM